MGSSTPSRTTVTRGGASCGGRLLSAVEYVSGVPLGCQRSTKLHTVELGHGDQDPTRTSSCTLSTKLSSEYLKPTRRSPW
eukprot:169821-Prymnesium_polylepis.1